MIIHFRLELPLIYDDLVGGAFTLLPDPSCFYLRLNLMVAGLTHHLGVALSILMLDRLKSFLLGPLELSLIILLSLEHFIDFELQFSLSLFHLETLLGNKLLSINEFSISLLQILFSPPEFTLSLSS